MGNIQPSVAIALATPLLFNQWIRQIPINQISHVISRDLTAMPPQLTRWKGIFAWFMGFVYLNCCSKFHHEYHDTKTDYELREKNTYLQFRHVGIFLSEISSKCKEMNLCRSDVHLSGWSIIIYQPVRVETIEFLDVSDCLETIHVLWRNMIRGAPVASHGFWFETWNVMELTRLQVREWILIDWLSYVQAKVGFLPSTVSLSWMQVDSFATCFGWHRQSFGRNTGFIEAPCFDSNLSQVPTKHRT